MESIVVRTSDNQEVKVDARIANLSRLLKEVSEGGSDIIPVQLPSDVFNKIVEFCQMHDYQPIRIEKPLKSSTLQENLKEKDYKFIHTYNFETIKPLLNAAYYLGMESLKDVCVCLIASEFVIGNSNEDIERIKDKFGITADMTLEEEEQIKKDFPWANEDEAFEGKVESGQEIMIVEEESKN